MATYFRRRISSHISRVARKLQDQRKPDGAVSSSEARLAGILSIAAEAIISIDDRQRITMFNHGAEAIFGYMSREILGQSLAILLPERFRQSHGRHIQQFAKATTTARRMGERNEIYGLRKDGTEFAAEASISKLEVDCIRTFTVVLRDITERVAREKALKASEERLEQRVAERTAELSALFDAVPDGIVTSDVEGRLRAANATAVKLFGYTAQDFLNMPASRLYATQADYEDVAKAWTKSAHDETQRPVSVTCRRKDGTTFHAMASGSAVRDSTGTIISHVGLIRDITDELKRQKVLAQAQRMEAYGQLTGGVAHDFNNLLTVITGNQELLEMRLKDAKNLTLLRRAQEAAEMGARLTGRLLTFARRRQLETTLLNLNDQIIGMVELLRRSIGEHVKLSTSLAPELGVVRADASEIENAVLNLAINARDAMPKGGHLLIETANCTLEDDELGSENKLPPGDYIRLTVSDSGNGMTQDVLQRAMEPFFTTKPQGKGTGLGLSTIYGFVQQSGGAMTIYSEPERGTTINIYLPRVVHGGKTASSEPAPTTTPIASGESVLVVEDNAGVRDITTKRLEELGYTVRAVENGPAALEVLQSSGPSFDLVFSDVVMPGGLSGYDIARWIREHRPNTKIMLTSGYPDEVARTHDGNVRAIKLLRKPYNRDELAQALRQILNT
jgi:PAS domain S-box-containing protein